MASQEENEIMELELLKKIQEKQNRQNDGLVNIEEHLKEQDEALINIKEHLSKHDKEMVWSKWFSVACIGISIVILGQAFRLGQQQFNQLAASVIDYFLFAIGIGLIGFAVSIYRKERARLKL